MSSCLIVLALASVAATAPQFFQQQLPTQVSGGFLQDTPEVLAARRSHLAEHARLGNNIVLQDSTFGLPQQQTFSNPNAPHLRFLNDPPGSAITNEGFLLDTAPVARATAIHYRELARARGLPTDQYDQYINSISV